MCLEELSKDFCQMLFKTLCALYLGVVQDSRSLSSCYIFASPSIEVCSSQAASLSTGFPLSERSVGFLIASVGCLSWSFFFSNTCRSSTVCHIKISFFFFFFYFPVIYCLEHFWFYYIPELNTSESSQCTPCSNRVCLPSWVK